MSPPPAFPGHPLPIRVPQGHPFRLLGLLGVSADVPAHFLGTAGSERMALDFLIGWVFLYFLPQGGWLTNNLRDGFAVL